MMLALNGDEAVAYAVKQSNVDVIAAFPITPQTIIVEKLSEYVANGELKAYYACAESEHSAISMLVGASAAGARTFTATSANGLALMHEILYIVSSLRLPVVMAIVNRALSGPINIHTDHGDSMAERDACWIQIYCEDAQEAYDTVIQAFRIGENHKVLLPVMVMLDGFLISHTTQNVDVLEDEKVSDFVKYRVPAEIEVFGKKVPLTLNPENEVPLTFGPLDLWDYYFEHKRQQEDAMEKSREVIRKVHDEYAKISGRRYGDGFIETYNMDSAEYAFICLSSTAGTVKSLIDKLISKGDDKLGLVRIRTFRPFPYEELPKTLEGVKGVAVLDRSGAFGAMGGPVYTEVRSALYDSDVHPFINGYIYGLGGRDMTMEMLKSIYDDLVETVKSGKPKRRIEFVGVRE